MVGSSLDDMTDSVLARGLAQIDTLLEAVGPTDLGRPTPCSDWAVRDLADHLVFSVTAMAGMARGDQIDWSANVPHHEDPAAAFHLAADDLLEAVATAGDLFPEGMAAGELAVHAYDLATGLGRDVSDLDPVVAEVGHDFMSGALSDELRQGAFEPEQPAPAGAGPYERLAAFAGRTVTG